MRLHLRRWGTGPRRALLVHGYSDDSETWWRVGPALASWGYEVLAPDLRGHGLSPRGRYSLELMAADVAETVGPVDLAIGHSLGGVVLHHALPSLDAQHALFVDPPWEPRLSSVPPRVPHAETVESVAAQSPAWDPQDVAVDVRSSLLLDPLVTDWLAAGDFGAFAAPTTRLVPSTVLVPAEGAVLSPVLHPRLLGLGYEIVPVPGVGHVIHRDALDAFLAACESATQVAAHRQV